MYGVKLRIWGDYGCFTRPEMKVERVSYDVITPSASRGILEAIYWKPEIKWVIDKIHVLKPIKFTNIRRNELSSKISVSNVKSAMKNGFMESLFIEDERQQRAAMVLKNVEYVIEAHFEIISGDPNEGKHLDQFNRRAKKGQCYHQPVLGCREFSANFELVDNDIPNAIDETRDLSWMLYDMDFASNLTEPPALFYYVKMVKGIIDVQKCLKESERR
ncbi:MAG: type I-C CRISPR-associated protein Cas5c [bacterium]